MRERVRVKIRLADFGLQSAKQELCGRLPSIKTTPSRSCRISAGEVAGQAGQQGITSETSRIGGSRVWAWELDEIKTERLLLTIPMTSVTIICIESPGCMIESCLGSIFLHTGCGVTIA